MFEDGLKYQDSRMATESELKKDLCGFVIGTSYPIPKGGPILFREGDTVYADSSEAHSLIVGDTGSMKTLRFVLPLIYSCAKAKESMVIVDPKGELLRKTKFFLTEDGYDLHAIDLRRPQDSPDKWNPMGRIEKHFDLGKAGEQEAILQLNDLIETLFNSRSSFDKDRYWNESAGQLALGLCCLMERAGDGLNMKNLLKWRYERMENGDVDRIFNNLPKEGEIYQNLAGYMELTASNTRSCILSTFDQLVRLFKASPALTEMLSEDTFDLSKIGIRKTAVFLIVPDEKTTFHFLATMFVTQCYQALLETAANYRDKLPRRVNFILEEFCNMPVLTDLISMLTAARSRNIRFHLVIQSYSQMIDKYKINASQTVLDNCGNLIYLHSREMSFLKYISELAGNNEYGRPLLSPSRLLHLKKNETVIFHDRCYPMVVRDIPLIFEYPVQLQE